MATDVIQLNRSFDRPSLWTTWTSLSCIATSILLTVLLVLFFIRSLLSNFVDKMCVMFVTLMISLKTCLNWLLFIFMDKAHVALATLMTTTVHPLGKKCARDDDDKPGAFSSSCCRTILQYLTYKKFYLQRMMLAYMIWLVRHLPFSTALEVHVGNYYSCSTTPALLNPLVIHLD